MLFLEIRMVPERLNLQSLHRTISQMGRANMTHSLSRWKRSFPQNSRTTGLSIIWIKETWSHAHIPFRITTIRMGMAKWSMGSYCSLTISHCWKARPPRRPDLQRPHNNAKSPAWIVCLTLHVGFIFLIFCSGLCRANLLMFIFKKLVNQIKIPGTTWNIFPCALHSITILAGKTEKANLFHTVWNGFWRFSHAEKDCHSGSLFIFSRMCCAIICLSAIF